MANNHSSEELKSRQIHPKSIISVSVQGQTNKLSLENSMQNVTGSQNYDLHCKFMTKSKYWQHFAISEIRNWHEMKLFSQPTHRLRNLHTNCFKLIKSQAVFGNSDRNRIMTKYSVVQSLKTWFCLGIQCRVMKEFASQQLYKI